MDNIQILKLVNGQTIVGITDMLADGNTYVQYPLEIITKSMPSPDGQPVGEMNHIRPYLMMTDVDNVSIDPFNIMTSFPLSESFHQSYNSLVETVYKQEVSYDGSFLDEVDEDPLAKDVEDLTEEEKEYLDGVLEQVTGSKRTVH